MWMVRGTDPVTAEGFDYAWKRMLAPASGSLLPNLLYDIQGARAYHQGEVTDPDRAGVRAISRPSPVIRADAVPRSWNPWRQIGPDQVRGRGCAGG